MAKKLAAETRAHVKALVGANPALADKAPGEVLAWAFTARYFMEHGEEPSPSDVVKEVSELGAFACAYDGKIWFDEGSLLAEAEAPASTIKSYMHYFYEDYCSALNRWRGVKEICDEQERKTGEHHSHGRYLWYMFDFGQTPEEIKSKAHGGHYWPSPASSAICGRRGVDINVVRKIKHAFHPVSLNEAIKITSSGGVAARNEGLAPNAVYDLMISERLTAKAAVERIRSGAVGVSIYDRGFPTLADAEIAADVSRSNYSRGYHRYLKRGAANADIVAFYARAEWVMHSFAELLGEDPYEMIEFQDAHKLTAGEVAEYFDFLGTKIKGRFFDRAADAVRIFDIPTSYIRKLKLAPCTRNAAAIAKHLDKYCAEKHAAELRAIEAERAALHARLLNSPPANY